MQFLQPVEYKHGDEIYTFYIYQPPEIDGGTGPINQPYRVQFCKKIGRKTDPFQCLLGWDGCPYRK